MPNLNITAVRAASTASVTDAGDIVTGVYNKFGMTPPPLAPTVENNRTESYHDPSRLTISYFHPDHLGSSSYITNAAGIVTQHLEYMAFGEVFVEEHSNSLNSPFKFNGKELDGETGNYYYGARYYDPKLSIFISVDPLAEKTMSAYGYCYNNPVRFIDPMGMSAEPPNDYVFDEKGKFVRIDKNDQPHRIHVENKKTGENRYYHFADPINDSKDIENGIINKIEFVKEEKVFKMLSDKGAFKSENSGYKAFYDKSKGGQDFDFRYSTLINEFKNPSQSLYIVDGEFTAHNFGNFGNWLWGAAGYTLGYEYMSLKAGAQINSLVNSKSNGYRSQWDSEDDQNSIVEGAYFSHTHNYRTYVK